MSIDYTTEVGYGFHYKGTSDDLEERLKAIGSAKIDNDAIEIGGWPETEILERMGFSKLQIIQQHAMHDDVSWAIVAKESYRYLYSKENEGVISLDSTHSEETENQLLELRSLLFNRDLEDSADFKLPKIESFIISSIW